MYGVKIWYMTERIYCNISNILNIYHKGNLERDNTRNDNQEEN